MLNAKIQEQIIFSAASDTGRLILVLNKSSIRSDFFRWCLSKTLKVDRNFKYLTTFSQKVELAIKKNLRHNCGSVHFGINRETNSSEVGQ